MDEMRMDESGENGWMLMNVFEIGWKWWKHMRVDESGSYHYVEVDKNDKSWL